MKTLLLASPVKKLSINQVFGVNKATYQKFGLAGHNGIDCRALHGDPVYASHEGIANYEVDKSGGHGVDLVSTEEYKMGEHGVAYARTRYWHLVDPKKEPKLASPIYGKKNVKVKGGDLIGYADSTGFSTGDHLHFGLKPTDKKGNPLFFSNGFKGAVDPQPFLNKIPNTTVSYEEAMTTLYRSGLPKPILLMALAVLKLKYWK